MQRPRDAGPTMSPSTAPASTEASCSGSPTRIRRASGRTASTRRAMSESDTIEVSSTTTTSKGSRFRRLWRKRRPVARVEAEEAVQGLAREGPQPLPHCVVDRHGRRHPSRTASSSRAAALPVGAARAIAAAAGPAPPPARRAAPAPAPPSRVLPVPGPPATHRHPAHDGGRRGHALEIGRVGARRRERPGPPRGRSWSTPAAGIEARAAQVVRRPGARRARGGRGRGSSRPGAAGGPRPTRALPASRLDPLGRIGPGQRREVGRGVGVAARRVADRGQVHADVAEAWCACRQGGAEPRRRRRRRAPSRASRRATCTSEGERTRPG